MTAGGIGVISVYIAISFAGMIVARAGTEAALLDFARILAAAWEWLSLLALAFWIGLLVTEGITLHRLVRASALLLRAKQRARPLRWLSPAALFASVIASPILRAAQGGQVPTATAISNAFFAAPSGSIWLASLGLLIISAALLLGMRRRASRLTLFFLLILSGLFLYARILSGDTIAPVQLSTSFVASAWLSLAAQLTWIGSTIYIAYIVWPLLPLVGPERSTETLLALLRRVNPLLLGCTGVLLISNIYLGASFPGTIQHLSASAYGRIVLAQWLLIALMLALGGYALFVLRPRMMRQTALLPVVNADLPVRRARQHALAKTAHGLRRSFVAASWIGMAALLCIVLLSFTQV